MKRRHLLAALGAGALAAPFASFAQQPKKTWRVGVLSLDAASSPVGLQQPKVTHEALRRAGYSVGRNLVVEWRFAEGKVESLPKLVDDLVRLKVDVIIAFHDNATLAAMRATRTIPIVMHYLVGDPVELGIIRSLAHPGGNVTGTTAGALSDIVAKQYQLLKEAAPAAVRVAALWRPSVPGGTPEDAKFREFIEKSLGIVIADFHVSRPEEIPPTLERIAASKPDALYVSTDPVVRGYLAEIAAFAIQRKLVTIGFGQTFVREGGLLNYGPSIPHVFERTASFVDRILRGASPADLPVERPTIYQLVVNGKTARAIGYKIPPALQPRVDRVIE